MIHSVNTAVTQKNEQTIGMAQFLRYILKAKKISDWFILCQHAYTHAHLYTHPSKRAAISRLSKILFS